jgi:hypothetical protein
MGVFEFILGIMLIGTIGGIVTNGMQVEKQRLKTNAASGEADDLRAVISDMLGEMGKLKDRVRVLERLATDGDRNLATEIERLRRTETSAGL